MWVPGTLVVRTCYEGHAWDLSFVHHHPLFRFVQQPSHIRFVFGIPVFQVLVHQQGIKGILYHALPQYKLMNNVSTFLQHKHSFFLFFGKMLHGNAPPVFFPSFSIQTSNQHGPPIFNVALQSCPPPPLYLETFLCLDHVPFSFCCDQCFQLPYLLSMVLLESNEHLFPPSLQYHTTLQPFSLHTQLVPGLVPPLHYLLQPTSMNFFRQFMDRYINCFPPGERSQHASPPTFPPTQHQRVVLLPPQYSFSRKRVFLPSMKDSCASDLIHDVSAAN